MNEGIDVVITWVDGSDVEHAKKRAKHLHESAPKSRNYAASNSRFQNSGELYLCIASILSFATFVRKIWIVGSGLITRI